MENNCINNLLKLICLLQNNSIINCTVEDCSRPFLGINDNYYNTRPINIYNKNGSLFTISIDGVDISTFRVESIDNNCVVLRALINNEGTILSTDSFITVNTNCICVVRCMDDISITNL